MNGKRILALAAVVLIALLYLATLVLALIGSPNTPQMLMACLFCTIVIPVVIYAWQIMLKIRDK